MRDKNPIVLAVIPARGGSKGVPGKNIAPVAGRPLIAHTLAAAQAAESVERVIVSTDSDEIAGAARAWGGEVPFLRPAELARDETPGIAPVIHAVRWLEEKENYRPDYVLLLQPTSPLRGSQDIDGAVELAREREAESVVSVCRAHEHPLWMKRMDGAGRLADYLPQGTLPPRRQDLPPAYALNGAIYLVRREVLLAQQSFYTEKSYGYVMPPERSLDIDTAWDLYLADLVLRDPRA